MRPEPDPESDGAPKPRTRIQKRNEARILDAALEVFSAHGFHGATIDRIAQGAGMSKPNVLYYFRTKRDIHAAVLQRTLVIWLEPLERLDPDGDPIEEIWRYAAVKLRLSREAPLASKLFANEMLLGAQTIQSFLDTELRELVERKCAVVRGGSTRAGSAASSRCTSCSSSGRSPSTTPTSPRRSTRCTTATRTRSTPARNARSGCC